MRIEEWLNVEFVRSEVTTDQFTEFANDVKAEIEDQLKDTGIVIDKVNVFCSEICGILSMKRQDKKSLYMYFKLPSPLAPSNIWFKSILIRQMDAKADFIGDTGRLTNMVNFKDTVVTLFKEVIRDEE